VPEIGFRDRLAYVRWLRARGKTRMEKDTELAEGLGVGYEWLKKWGRRAEAPEGRTQYEAIRRALEPIGVAVDWLYDGVGETPHPELWAFWVEAMRDLGTDELGASQAREEPAPPRRNRLRNGR
jgi:hypothetical protein